MKVITMVGADHKVGTTQITQSIAEMMARLYPQKKVLRLPLDGNRGTEYINQKFLHCIDHIRAKVLSEVITVEELLEACNLYNGVYCLQGTRVTDSNQLYNVEFVEKLLGLAKKHFDLIIIDAGANCFAGLSIGAMRASEIRILVSTQQHLASRNFDLKKMNIFSRLEIEFSSMLINKYVINSDLLDSFEINQKYGLEVLGEMPMLEIDGWVSEVERKSLLHFDEKFSRQIQEICVKLAEICGFDQVEIGKKDTFFGRLMKGVRT